MLRHGQPELRLLINVSAACTRTCSSHPIARVSRRCEHVRVIFSVSFYPY